MPFDIVYPRGDKGDRGSLSAVAYEGDRGSLSAVADDADLRGSGWIGVVSVVSSSYAIGLQMW